MPRTPENIALLHTPISIPVRPAVAKYLRAKYHLAEGQAFRLTKKDKLGRFLYHLLCNPQQDKQYAITPESHPQRFPVVVSYQFTWLNGCRHLTEQGIHDFNRQVEDMMEEDFLKTVETLAKYSVKFETKQVALDFMRLNQLTEDDITLDALIKAYYRFRKAQDEAKKRLLNIPNCPVALAA